MSNGYNNIEMYRVSDIARERAQMIRDLPTGVHAGKTSDGKFCSISIVQGELMIVQLHNGLRNEVTKYNSAGEIVEHYL